MSKAPMKALAPRTARPKPEEVLAAAEVVAPAPVVEPEKDHSRPFHTKFRHSTVASLEAVAQARGMTMKQVIAHALVEAGVAVNPVDLEDRTPAYGKNTRKS